MMLHIQTAGGNLWFGFVFGIGFYVAKWLLSKILK